MTSPHAFTEADLRGAFLLAHGDEDAARLARAAAGDEHLPERTLTLRSLARPEFRAKVEAHRAAKRVAARAAWLRRELARAGLAPAAPAPEWIAQKWNQVADHEDEAFARRVAGLEAEIRARNENPAR